MLIKPTEIFPSDFDVVWDALVSADDSLSERIHGVTYEEYQNRTKSERYTWFVEELYKTGTLLTALKKAGMWMPVEAVKVLQGEELTREEQLNLAEILLKQSGGEYDPLLPFYRYIDYSIQLFAEAWGKELPEAEAFTFTRLPLVEKPVWGGLDALERVKYFFGHGIPQVIDDKVLSAALVNHVEKIYDGYCSQIAFKYDELDPKDLSPSSNFDGRVQSHEFDSALVNYVPTRDLCLFDAQRECLSGFFGDLTAEYRSYSSYKTIKESSLEEAPLILSRMEEFAHVFRGKGNSTLGDLWLKARHIWQSVGFSVTRYPEFGMTWSWWYGLLVLFGVGVLAADFGGLGVSVFPVYLGVFLVPLVGFWLALRFVSKRTVWLVLLGILIVGLIGRFWLISDPAGIGGIDPSMMLLTFLVGVVVGLYPVYWGGSYRQVLRNADKYGPFACVWFRPFKDETTGKDGVEFVLTDSDGEIVWIRRMSQSAAERFTGQFVYEHPDSGVWDFFGAEEHWRQVFPALVCPREIVRDWKYWWTIFRVTGRSLTPNSFGLENVSLIENRAWWKWLCRETILWRPETLSEAHVLDVPGLSYESRDTYIGEFGLDKHPRGYEQALNDGRLVKANAKY